MKCLNIVLIVFLGFMACNKGKPVPQHNAPEQASKKTAQVSKPVGDHDTSTIPATTNSDTVQGKPTSSPKDTINESEGAFNQIDTSHSSPLCVKDSVDTIQQTLSHAEEIIRTPSAISASVHTAPLPQTGKISWNRYQLLFCIGFALILLIILFVDLYRRKMYGLSPSSTKYIMVSLIPFYAASLFLFLLSILFFSLAISANEYSALFIISHVGLLVSSVIALILPSLFDSRQIALFSFPDAVNVAARSAGDLKRDYNRMISSLEGLQNQTQSHLVSMDSIRKAIEENLINRIQFENRIGEEVSLRTKVENQVTLLVDKVCDYVRVLERLNSAQGLSDDYLAAVVQCREYLNKSFMPLNISIIIPQVGDDFDAQMHEANGELEMNNIEPGRIARVLTWGILTPANCERSKVLLAKPVSQNIDKQEESCPSA